MEKAATEKLANLRQHLSWCGDNAELRSRIETEIREVLSGQETAVVTRNETPADAETRVVDNAAWLKEARRRVERAF
jgi:hypothetical protein